MREKNFRAKSLSEGEKDKSVGLATCKFFAPSFLATAAFKSLVIALTQKSFPLRSLCSYRAAA
jgi:hypothetical protein